VLRHADHQRIDRGGAGVQIEQPLAGLGRLAKLAQPLQIGQGDTTIGGMGFSGGHTTC
jgi:hypothetical protein